MDNSRAFLEHRAAGEPNVVVVVALVAAAPAAARAAVRAGLTGCDGGGGFGPGFGGRTLLLAGEAEGRLAVRVADVAHVAIIIVTAIVNWNDFIVAHLRPTIVALVERLVAIVIGDLIVEVGTVPVVFR